MRLCPRSVCHRASIGWPVSTATLVTSGDSDFHNKLPENIFHLGRLIYNFGSYSNLKA